MKSLDVTFRKFSSRGVDGASGFLGIGLGLTLALQVTRMRQSDVSTVYAAVATSSRLCALTGTYFALVGIFLVARIPWVERGVGPDGALCDALATALMVDGRDAQRWMGRPELAEYSFWVINRDGETAWSY
jgi:hypothetical protein